MAPLIGKVLRLAQVENRRQFVAAGRIAQLHRRVGVDSPKRQIFGHAFDEPQRQTVKRGLLPVAHERAAHVELKRMHQFVADHVIGIGDRS